MEDLKKRAVQGGFAKIWAQAAIFLFRVGSLMILARLLSPSDFGLVGMVTAVTGVLSLFKDAGLSTATVQRVDISENQISTLFWVNVLVGVVLGLLSLALAPILVAVYHEPRLFWVTAALAIGFLLNAAGVQHTALLQRQMRFITLAIIETSSWLVGAAVGVGMAVAGCGYWSLVGMSVSSPAAFTIGAWLALAWVPGAPRRHVGIRSLLGFGGTVTLNGLVVYVAYNSEKVLLGRFWGADALGIYGRAYQLASIPTENLNSAIGGVAFSALSRLQNEPERFKNYFLKGYALALALTLPITFVCAIFAEEIIFVVLGPAWKNTATILRLLTPTILVFGLINPLAWLLFSMGLVSRSLRIALVLAPLIIVSYILGLSHGPTGVAFAYSLAMVLWVVPHIAWCVHGTMFSLRDIGQAVSRPFLSACAAATLALAAKFTLGHRLPALSMLVLGGLIFAVPYLWILFYIMKQKAFYLDLLRRLKKSSYPR